MAAINSGKGYMASFLFAQDLGLALVAKTCSRRPQASKRVNSGQTFPLETSIVFFLFSNEPIAGSMRHACTFFTQIMEDLTAYVASRSSPV